MATSVKEPGFITYLLSPDLDHDCYFLVGNSQHEEPEKIGVVKKMLLAHSVVLRTELQDSKMSEKGVVRVEDLYPDTFRNLLKYVYGYDNISGLSFDEADNLLYAAEKYLMDPLKAKISVVLIPLLDCNNILNLMNNPACFKVLELNSTITKILQDETDNVLANPLFPDLCPAGFIKILEQDMLNVPEIELWRAAVKWGKHRVDTEDVEGLRKTLADPMKHVRILTLDALTFCKEVVRTRILTSDEIDNVCTFYDEGIPPVGMMSFSCNTEPRAIAKILQIKFNKLSSSTAVTNSTFKLKNYARGIILMPMEFEANSGSSNSTYMCECTIKISDITDTAVALDPITITFRDQVKYGLQFFVPITNNGANVRLLPNHEYRFEVTFTQPHPIYFNYANPCSMNAYSNEDFSISVVNYSYSLSMGNFYGLPVKYLNYRLSHV